jgi:3-oxoacyl-(acyl-carrier-protein) synthase
MAKSMRIEITGCGIVNACGVGVDAFVQSLLAGRPSLSPIHFADASHPVKVGGIAHDFRVDTMIDRRFAVKTDRFTHFALTACDAAMREACIELKDHDLERAGVWFGNNSGGWDICERGFRELYLQGVEMVNPWQATAWFPAAPQGFVSIRYGLMGTSKSFVADRATGLVAVIHGARSVLRDENDWVLAGGTEAPLTSFGATCYYETGELAKEAEAQARYITLGEDVSGLVLGEGAAVVCMENPNISAQRKQPALASIVGAAISTDPGGKGHALLSQAISKALAQAQLRIDEVDLVYGEGNGVFSCNELENSALAEVFCELSKKPLYTSIKAYTGHLYGAAGATEIVAAIGCAQRGQIPATLHVQRNARWSLPIVTTTIAAKVRNVLVLARAREGVNAVLILQMPTS